MLKLEEICDENFYDVVNLKIDSSQVKFVASNDRSLAECYLYRDNNDVFPFAIKVSDVVVGFVMYYTDDAEVSATVWRIMIDKNYQGKGYGKKAMIAIEKVIKSHGKYKTIHTSYNNRNKVAEKLYLSLGYKESRVNEHKEIVVSKSLD